MSDHRLPSASAEPIEDVLRAQLAHGDGILATTGPVLRHLLVNDDQTLFSDQVIARVRGMIADVARQLLFVVAELCSDEDKVAFVDGHANDLAVSLLGEASLLSHAHALTVEALTAERLGQRSGIDPVLSPLLQELAASRESEMASLAMRTLASQARFMQQQRRMSLPINELPEDLFNTTLALLHGQLPDQKPALDSSEAKLREEYAPENCRVHQIGQLISGMRHEAERALDVDHAGVAIFATALGMASDQTRDTAILTLVENQSARLALSLLSAGLKHSAVEDQFLFLHLATDLPEDFEALTKQQATAMLSAASAGEEG